MSNLREYVQEKMSLWLGDLIIENAVKREYIHVDEYLRGIGKTTALVKFANIAKVALVVPQEAQARYIKMNFDMSVPVISQHQADSLRDKNMMVVFDEGVDPKNLSDLKVATGFLKY